MIPRVRIAHLPTPIEPMARIGAALGGVKLWVKRDDLTGLAGGGNKIRKLEYVLAEAQANGARTLITVGAVQSNHCRQTAALAARFGLECILVLSGEKENPPSGNLLLDQLFGAEIIYCRMEERDQVLQQAFEEAWSAGKRPFLIPLGASTPVGAVGYLTAFEEFLSQGVEVDWIVVATSSAGTQAGLVLGALRTGWKGKVLGISIDHPAAELQQRVAELVNESAERVGLKVDCQPEEVMVNDQYLGKGYGIPSPQEVEAIRLFARYEGLLLDPVYTGRAAAGLLDLVRTGFFTPQDRVLFWHTGGTPALFAERYRSLIGE
ncbi:MAG: 1-aminocyclopropane-1-carboxylate deaminase [Bellilinea sp.]|nr:MAG: 1-aminocyclopropane-1-carboxylate deaminase [Bellilinea sp.]